MKKTHSIRTSSPSKLKLMSTQSITSLGVLIGMTLTDAQAEYSLQLSAMISTEGSAQAVAHGDVTGDGVADIVLVNNGFAGGTRRNHVVIFEGADNGGLSGPLTVSYSALDTEPRGLTLMNVDDDDVLEIVVGHDRELTIINQSAQGPFFGQVRATPHDNDVLAVLDFNLDGTDELLSVQTVGRQRLATVYEVGLDGALVPLDTQDWSASGQEFDLKILDFDHNGVEDVLLMNGGSSLSPDLSIHARDLLGDWMTPVRQSVGDPLTLTGSMAVGDLNADGLNDVWLTEASLTDAFVLSQDEMGTLTETDGFEIQDNAVASLSEDLDGDGLDDVLVAHDP